MDRVVWNRYSVGLMLIFISSIFLAMIRPFLMAILMAGIFSALVHPLYRRLLGWYRGRATLASLTLLILTLLVVIIPLAGLFGLVVSQAIEVGQSITPWVQKEIAQPTAVSEALGKVPFYDRIEPYRDILISKAGQLVAGISGFLIQRLSSAAQGTVHFIFMLFVFLYTTFFLLPDGQRLLDKILYYLPLQERDEQRMLVKFSSVTRATLKGTAVIALIQGTLGGIAFAVAGIEWAVFWGTLMAILSIIPAVGSSLIWFPAGIILIVGGHYAWGAGLLVFCAVVIGSIDNLLRPILVGKDTKMHELLIFFGTLGGIAMFGLLGFIIGPIIAALFVTIWEVYGEVFGEFLPSHLGQAQQPHSEKE